MELKQSSTEGTYNKFNIILGWKMNKGKAFATLVTKYIKSPAVIVDLTAGERNLYRQFNNGNTLTGRYTFIFGDIRNIPGNQYTCDILNPPQELYGVADGYIFDPPWPSVSGSLREIVNKYHPLTPKEFEMFLPVALQEIEKILKPNGILIMKISHPWNHITYNLLADRFKWLRDIIQVSVNQGVYLVTYFMIFKKHPL